MHKYVVHIQFDWSTAEIVIGKDANDAVKAYARMYDLTTTDYTNLVVYPLTKFSVATMNRWMERPWYWGPVATLREDI